MRTSSCRESAPSTIENAINTIAEIRERVYASLGADGFTLTGKERRFESSFASCFIEYVQDPRGGINHTARVAGSAEPIEFAGISAAQYRDLRQPAASRPVIALNWPADGVAHLAIRTFGDPRLHARGPSRQSPQATGRFRDPRCPAARR